MGIETAILLGAIGVASAGMQAYQGYQEYDNAEDQANAAVRQGQKEAQEAKEATTTLAGQQKASFLASGFTLEGTPQVMLSETYSKGKEDVTDIKEYYNSMSKSYMSQGRTAFIKGLTSAGITLATTAVGINSLGAAGTAGTAGSSASTSGSYASIASLKSSPQYISRIGAL